VWGHDSHGLNIRVFLQTAKGRVIPAVTTRFSPVRGLSKFASSRHSKAAQQIARARLKSAAEDNESNAARPLRVLKLVIGSGEGAAARRNVFAVHWSQTKLAASEWQLPFRQAAPTARTYDIEPAAADSVVIGAKRAAAADETDRSSGAEDASTACAKAGCAPS